MSSKGKKNSRAQISAPKNALSALIGFFEEHPGTIITLAYFLLSFLGLWWETEFLKDFGVSFLQFADSADFFLGFLRFFTIFIEYVHLFDFGIYLFGIGLILSWIPLPEARQNSNNFEGQSLKKKGLIILLKEREEGPSIFFREYLSRIILKYRKGKRSISGSSERRFLQNVKIIFELYWNILKYPLKFFLILYVLFVAFNFQKLLIDVPMVRVSETRNFINEKYFAAKDILRILDKKFGLVDKEKSGWEIFHKYVRKNDMKTVHDRLEGIKEFEFWDYFAPGKWLDQLLYLIWKSFFAHQELLELLEKLAKQNSAMVFNIAGQLKEQREDDIDYTKFANAYGQRPNTLFNFGKVVGVMLKNSKIFTPNLIVLSKTQKYLILHPVKLASVSSNGEDKSKLDRKGQGVVIILNDNIDFVCTMDHESCSIETNLGSNEEANGSPSGNDNLTRGKNSGTEETVDTQEILTETRNIGNKLDNIENTIQEMEQGLKLEDLPSFKIALKDIQELAKKQKHGIDNLNKKKSIDLNLQENIGFLGGRVAEVLERIKTMQFQTDVQIERNLIPFLSYHSNISWITDNCNFEQKREIRFDNDDFETSAQGVLKNRKKIDQWKKAQKTLALIGYSDGKGPALYNLILSETRVRFVWDQLTAMEFPKDRIKAFARGEEDADQKNIENPQMRKVEIIPCSPN